MDRNRLTLLAVLALSVSNLFVGISAGDKSLILASAAISAALAVFYIVRELLQARRGAEQALSENVVLQPRTMTRARFPLWVFIVILFVILPALMWFLQLTTQ